MQLNPFNGKAGHVHVGQAWEAGSGGRVGPLEAPSTIDREPGAWMQTIKQGVVICQLLVAQLHERCTVEKTRPRHPTLLNL